jgi:hypothetical protein
MTQWLLQLERMMMTYIFSIQDLVMPKKFHIQNLWLNLILRNYPSENYK